MKLFVISVLNITGMFICAAFFPFKCLVHALSMRVHVACTSQPLHANRNHFSTTMFFHLFVCAQLINS